MVLQDGQLSTNVQAIANNLAIASSKMNRLGRWAILWHQEPVRPAPSSPAITHTLVKI